MSLLLFLASQIANGCFISVAKGLTLRVTPWEFRSHLV
jgi:hypothetical protein